LIRHIPTGSLSPALCFRQKKDLKLNNVLIEWKKAIIEVVKDVQTEYSCNKGLFLTEGDVECHLYKRLTEKPIFSEYGETKTDSCKSGYVHSQVTWFKESKPSGYEVDLTILNPANLKIEHLELIEDIPHKGFFHDGIVTAIEIKFIRNSDDSNIKNKAIEDYNKIIRLKADKKSNIENGVYSNVSDEEMLFIPIVVCKTKEIYDIAYKQISSTINKDHVGIIPIIFCSDAIKVFDNT